MGLGAGVSHAGGAVRRAESTGGKGFCARVSGQREFPACKPWVADACATLLPACPLRLHRCSEDAKRLCANPTLVGESRDQVGCRQ